MNKSLSVTAIFLLVTFLGACASLTSKPIFTDDAGALRGYDPVSYFTEERAVPGDRSISYRYAGADFYFSSDHHRALFINSPEDYLPEYGGYCAYGMSRNFVVSSDPQAFTLVDGKLYLNYSLKVRKTWLKDVPGNITRADKNWAKKLDSKEKIEE